MLLVKFLLFCFTFSGIASEGMNITVVVKPKGDCNSLLPIYKFYDGSNITVDIKSNLYINYGWLRLIDSTEESNKLLLNLKSSNTLIANKYQEGTWELQLLYLRNVNYYKELMVMYENSMYHQIRCRFHVEIASPPNNDITVVVKPGADCSSLMPAYNFTEGSNTTFIIQNNIYINFGWLRLIDSSGSPHLLLDLNDSRTITSKKSQEGIWELELLFLKDVIYNEESMVIYEESSYNQLKCRFNVTVNSISTL